MHSGTGKALISRFHWILQRTPKSVLFSRLAIGPSTNNPDKVREQGFSALYGPQANEVTQEIPNKTLLMHCAAALFVCLLVFGSPLFFFSSFLLFGIPGEISKHSQSVPHVLSCVPCFPFSRHAAASESVQSKSTLSGNEQAAALSSNQDWSKNLNNFS